MKCISYKKGYKYQLAETYIENIGITPEKEAVIEDYITLTTEGELTIKKGYAWDGPSGPTFDTKNFMRGSLVHDALYQLMRDDELAPSKYREPADRLIQRHCKEDGMNPIRAAVVYRALRIAGEPASRRENKKETIKAPKACN